MHGDMAGFFEVRVDGPDRRHYRLFCVIDVAAEGAKRPYLTVIQGLSKPFKSKFATRDYAPVAELRREYESRKKRSLYDAG